MKVAIVDELLLVSKSDSFALTTAVLLSWPLLEGVTTIVILADEPLTRLPRPQLIVEVPLHEPCVGVADTKVTPAGKVSLTFTPVAPAGPLFVTTIR